MQQPWVWAPGPGFSTVMLSLGMASSCPDGVMISSFAFPCPFFISLFLPFSLFFFPPEFCDPRLSFFLNVFFSEAQASLKLSRYTRLAWSLTGWFQTLYPDASKHCCLFVFILLSTFYNPFVLKSSCSNIWTLLKCFFASTPSPMLRTLGSFLFVL